MNALSSPETPTAALAGKYLTVVLANEAYGISVLKVREIIRLQKVTPVPQMPEFVKGVINLRGRVIPVMDLRLKFKLAAELTERTCIVVVQIATDQPGRSVPMGLIVDSVEEVINLAAGDIEPTPQFGVQVDVAYLLGMARFKGQVSTLLHIDRVVGLELMDTLPAA